MSGAARFREADLTRAVRGAVKAGMRVGRVEIDRNGKIVILSEAVAPREASNSFDEVLEQ